MFLNKLQLMLYELQVLLNKLQAYMYSCIRYRRIKLLLKLLFILSHIFGQNFRTQSGSRRFEITWQGSANQIARNLSGFIPPN